MAIAVRYPGRACLLGDHCDWAGGASLAIPLPLGISMVVEPATAGLRARSSLGGRLLDARWPVGGAVEPDGGPLRFVGAAAAVLAERGAVIPPAELWIHSDLPAGRGFSSSAALSLAALDALSLHAGEALEADLLAELAYVVEHDRLKVACGRLDPMACAAGAPVFLRWRDGRAPLVRISPGARVPMVVAALPQSRDTAGLLTALNQANNDLLSPVGATAHATFRRFGLLAEAGTLSLQRGDLTGLGDAMNQAQAAYDALADQMPILRAPALTAACHTLSQTGALGAKFSGAGGAGSVVAVFANAAAAAEGADALRALDCAAWPLTLEQA